MDLDTITSELNNVVRYRGGGGLVEAAASAPKLLAQPRYQGPGNPRERLATDIRSAIGQLPRDVRRHAKGLLPIDHPNDSISGRLERLGIDGYSSPAKRWHRRAILGRVADGLLGLYAETPPLHPQPSYRLHSIDVLVSDYASKGTRPLARINYHRHLRLSWTMECLVSDLRLFAFRVKAVTGLKFAKLAPGADGPRFTSVERLRHGGHDGDWHILFLENVLPTNSLVTLSCAIDYTATDQTPTYFDFVPEAATERLSLTYEAGRAVSCKCEAWNDKAKANRYSPLLKPRMLKAYKGKTISYEDGPFDECVATQFRVPKAKNDRRYRLAWGRDS